MKTITYQGEELVVKTSTYRDNGNTALLIKTKANELYMTASVNMSDELPENHIVIKDYAENAGILKALEEANIVKVIAVTDLNSFNMGGHGRIGLCLLNIV